MVFKFDSNVKSVHEKEMVHLLEISTAWILLSLCATEKTGYFIEFCPLCTI